MIVTKRLANKDIMKYTKNHTSFKNAFCWNHLFITKLKLNVGKYDKH